MAKCNFLLQAKAGRKHGLCCKCDGFDICSCVSIRMHTCTHRTMSDGPIYHPVILLHYGLASGCCLATVISPVVVTAVVAICSTVAQLPCPGLIAHCFHTPPHTTAARLLVPFELCKWQSPFVGRDLVLCCSNSACTSYGCNAQFEIPD